MWICYSFAFISCFIELNDIRINHPEVPNPSLGELVPAFMYEPEHQAWASVVKFPLERSLKKVDKLAHRQNIREKVNAEWGDPKKAPSALKNLKTAPGFATPHRQGQDGPKGGAA